MGKSEHLFMCETWCKRKNISVEKESLKLHKFLSLAGKALDTFFMLCVFFFALLFDCAPLRQGGRRAEKNGKTH